MTRTEAGEKAIEALKLLNRGATIGDFVYQIRDSELKGWDGPRVKAWSDGAVLAAEVLKAVGP